MEYFNFVFDQRLLPWVLTICAGTYWLKRKGMPSWFPLPALVFILSFVISALFGFAVDNSHSEAGHLFMAILVYGLGNGLFISLIACYGYDMVHAILKGKVEEDEEVEETKAEADPKVIKEKALVYGLSSASGALIMAIIAACLIHESLDYVLYYALFGILLAFSLSRICYHMYKGDACPKCWAISIYSALTAFSWLAAILSSTWTTTSLFLALMTLTAVLTIGYRFVDKNTLEVKE